MLGQLAVEAKSNEITAVPQLLELLSLRGKVVTADAMHCQRHIAQQVVEQGGDYVLALKGNQSSLYDDVKTFLDDAATPVVRHTQHGKGHGRVETRIAQVSSDVDWLQESHHWLGLQAVGKVTATRHLDGAESNQTRYYLMSEAFPPERFNQIVRAHWGIENRLHWVLDVTCNEDQARNRRDNCAANLALLRKLALNLARLEPSKGSMRGKLKRAGWDDTFLVNMLSHFSEVHMR